MALRKASDLFVECLEAEGVKHVFGIPGEETLDLNESLAESSIQFVPVRHEQGGAYMADVYGRLTGRAGVCLGTLGPGAMNLVTAVADAFLDRAPLVALTGQADLERMHKESHQYIDLVEMMRPITKWNARLTSPEIIPEALREAADLIRQAINPIALVGNGVIRAGAAPALREFARATGISIAETFMGKGAIDYADPRALGTVGLQSRDYAMAGFEDADVVIAIGYDLVEHAPKHWNLSRDKKIVVVDSVPAEIDGYFTPEVELVGDIYHVLSRLAEECRDVPHSGGSQRLREVVLGRFDAARQDEHFPMQPPRALWEIRQAMGREDILI